ncbi:MAG TPA: S1C family serine protease [Alphaproteobacteria bacterium]|nr:S1C family serine protease [Alphaproteobacteria bacterium]
MANGHVSFAGMSIPSLIKLPTAAALAVLTASQAVAAEAPSLEELLDAVVRIKTFIAPDGRTVETLGSERQGSGIVIDQNGLVLTIGYLMVEAYKAEVTTNSGKTVPASVVGYDQETGFGLLRTAQPLRVHPMPFGKSKDLKPRDPVLIASFGGPEMAAPAFVVAKRPFAGNWEYMLDQAIFTAPPHPAWSGAALLNRAGKLVGVGSLVVSDAEGDSTRFPGNMFVPIDLLPPILGDLIVDGRISTPGHPWLGVTADEVRGRLVVSRLASGGPAEKAGLQEGDVIIAVNGGKTTTLVDFYQKVWAQGPAGTTVRLDVIQEGDVRHLNVKSVNRLDYLKLKTSL